MFMKPQPKLQVTGYRGIWGESLNEQIAFEHARAYARMINSLPSPTQTKSKKILVGRDARPTGIKIFQSIQEALEKEKIEVVDAGIIPTPSILLLVKKLNFDGGIMITASHNPSEYNGIKFVVPPGRLTNESEVAKIEKLRLALGIEEKTPSLSQPEYQKIDNKEFRKIHIDEILKNIDADLIRNKKFKVSIDTINGAGSVIALELLKELECEVHVINNIQDGTFAHEPEPLAQNLGQIMQETLKNEADIGFALDPDADRLATVDEEGQYITEEHTLVLIIKNVLAKEPSDTVINIQTSNMGEDVTKEYGQKTFRTKVGEANVVQKMTEVDAAIGGEGGGGGIYPKINSARDGLVCMALILELMARESKKISEIVAGLPKYYMKKDKIPVTKDVQVVYEKLKKEFSDAEIVEIDGVRFDWPDHSWLAVRASITEPIIRIYGEAKTQEHIEEIFKKAKLTLAKE